jgi:hypothetical protein
MGPKNCPETPVNNQISEGRGESLESFKSFSQIHRLVDGPAKPVSSPIVTCSFFRLGTNSVGEYQLN